VTAGETAWDIAIRYNIDLGELIALNNLGPNAVLSIGDELIVVTPTATPLPTETPTQTPGPTATATVTLTPTASATAQAVSRSLKAAAPTATPSTASQLLFGLGSLNQIGLLASIFLLTVGLSAIIIVWRRV
jgi:hypothetical protein